MKKNFYVIPATICLGLCVSLSSCNDDKESKTNSVATSTEASAKDSKTNLSADEFIAKANKLIETETPEFNAAQWVYETYITDDSGILASKASERFMTIQKDLLAEARNYKNATMSVATSKAYTNLTQGKELLPPDN